MTAVSAFLQQLKTTKFATHMSSMNATSLMVPAKPATDAAIFNDLMLSSITSGIPATKRPPETGAGISSNASVS